jgi:hypothetical protein
MAKQLVITLSEEATAAYLKAASARLEAEVNNHCEPSSATINVEIASSFYDSTVMMNNQSLGTVEVDFIES